MRVILVQEIMALSASKSFFLDGIRALINSQKTVFRSSPCTTAAKNTVFSDAIIYLQKDLKWRLYIHL